MRLCVQIGEVDRIAPAWREAVSSTMRQTSAPKDGDDDDLEDENGGGGGGSGGGGGMGLAPSVSTLAREEEDCGMCKTDLCYLASTNDVAGALLSPP